MARDRAALRIGEVSRRTGVGVSTLRAWERRYGVLEPERTEGGHRLYGEADIERVRAVALLIEEGLHASAAAAEVRDRQTVATVTELRPADGRRAAEELTTRLKLAIDDFDAAAAERALDDVLARLDPAAALEHVILPAVRWTGENWAADPRIIAREHFATRVVTGRLLRIIRSSTTTPGRTLVAAGPELDEHEVGILAAATVAVVAGWHVHLLGARTPRAALEKAVAELRPTVVVIGGVTREHAEPLVASPPDVGGRAIVFGGPGFEPADGQRGRRIIVHEGPLQGLPDTLERAREISVRTG